MHNGDIHAAVYAASFSATIQHYRWTSVELTDAVYDLAHEHAVKTADGAVEAMARAEKKAKGE